MAVQRCNGLGCIRPKLKMNICESLALPRLLVLRQINLRHRTEGFDQLLQVLIGGGFANIGYANCCELIPTSHAGGVGPLSTAFTQVRWDVFAATLFGWLLRGEC